MLSSLKSGPAALVLGALLLSPVHAVEKSTGLKPTVKAAQIKKPTVGGGATGTGTTVAELSAFECRQVGGTVVTVGDNRCGDSRKYCRMPDTNAICIDELSAD